MGKKNGITIYSIVGDGKSVLCETTTEVFLRQVHVRRRGERILMQMEAVEIDMPLRVAEELVWDLMEMLDECVLEKLIKEIGVRN